ncbi:TPA: hypothetical protein ACGO8I_002141 [Streptococcus suis]
MAEIPYFHRVLRTYLKEQLYPTLMQEGGYQKGNVPIEYYQELIGVCFIETVHWGIRNRIASTEELCTYFLNFLNIKKLSRIFFLTVHFLDDIVTM